MNQEEKQRPHPFRNDFAVQPAFRENGHRLFGRRQFACPIIPTPAESGLQLRVRCYGR